MLRLFPTTNFFILGSAAFIAGLPALTFSGYSFSSNGPLAEVFSSPSNNNLSSLADANDGSGSSVQFSSNTQGGGSNSHRTSIKLNVNGQEISLPDNGSSQQTTTNADGTQVHINAQHSQTGDAQGTSQSSTSINIFSGTNSTVLNNEQTEN